MRFFYTNLFDTATLTPSSEATALPVENAQDSRARKVWRTGATLTTEYVVGDMGSAKAVTAAIIHAHTLIAGDTNIKFQMNATDSWGSPSFSTNLTRIDKTFGAAFASQSYRYFRFVFDKATAASTRDIGRLFVGTYLEPTVQIDYSGLEYQIVDASDVDESLGEDEYAEIKNKHAEFSTQFNVLPDADFTSLKTYFEAVGKYTPHFVQIETSGDSTYYYVRLTKPLKKKSVGYGSSYFWDVTLDYREQVT